MSDIFTGQPTPAEILAEIYDLEHDELTEDRVFYREFTRRSSGSVVDLGCGSGRLFEPLLDGRARRILGIDGSAALLDRARARIAASPRLAAAAREGSLSLALGDVRSTDRPDRFGLAVLAGVVAHLGGAGEATRALRCAAGLLEDGGLLIIDSLGPGGLPTRDLPLSVDWRRELRGREVVRSSQLTPTATADGVVVLFATMVEVPEADGTIARLPASYRLWYPYPSALLQLVSGAGLVVEATYGSHDLEPLGPDSERCIVAARRPNGGRGIGRQVG